MSQTFTAYDPAALPAVVTEYMDAHDAARQDPSRHADAAACFTADAVVMDDGTTYAGREDISRWIRDSSSEFEYTSTRVGQQIQGGQVDVQVRLVGNFPGGTVTLRYSFTVADGGIRALVIAAQP